MAAGSVMTSQVMAGVPTTTCGELAATNGLIGIRLQLGSVPGMFKPGSGKADALRRPTWKIALASMLLVVA